MANKFADINRGPELAKAYDALQDWRKLDKAAKKVRYNAVKKTSARVKVEYETAYIVPFSAARNDIYFPAKVPAATQSGTGDAVVAIVRTLITGRYVTPAPTGATVTILPKIPRGFSFAKVRATTRVGTPVVNAVSRITGNPYTRISTESASGSFGQGPQTDYEASRKAIKAIPAYATFDNAEGNSLAIIPEQG